MWRSTNKKDELTIERQWLMYPIEHPNVDMKRFTNYVDPATGNSIIRDKPKFNFEKAQEYLVAFRNRLNTFAPVRASEGSGR